jgi:mannose-6-phosphate isomerase-like protein (cupin superfamily)
VGESEVVEDPAWYTAATSRPVVVTGEDGVTLSGLGGPADRFRSTGTVATVAPGASGNARPRTRSAEHLVLGQEGTVEFDVSGVHYTVREGDALHIPAERPYRYHNPGTEPARLVWFTTG